MRFQVVQQLLLVASTLPECFAAASGLTVTLDGYGSFVGTTINRTLTEQPLPAPVDAWLGIDYATQPIGNSRFARVAAPKAFSGTKDATQYGYACEQDPARNNYTTDEACLNMNVYRPQGLTGTEKLPVLVWIHGINSLGFLPSPVFERLGLLNLGLLDQQLLFEFVQKHVSAFGGDADKVTIGGSSAGAHSVGIHLFHNYNKTSGPSPLFSQAMLQSGSVTSRSLPNASYPLYQAQFARYLELTGCGNSTDDADESILACLRAAPIDRIASASTLLSTEYEYALTWPFQPTRGGPLLEQAGSISDTNEQFFHIPVLTSNVPDEAKLWTTGVLETNEEFLAFMKNLIPGLSSQDLDDLEALYPDPAVDANSPYANSPNSTQYNRLSAAVSDYMYICSVQETAVRMSRAGAPVYKMVFATNNSYPSWQSIPHAADGRYTYAEPLQGGSKGVQYPEVGRLLQGYLADFVVSGNPNGKQSEGALEWTRYVDGGETKLGLQLRMEPLDNSTVEADDIRREQCEWWRDESRAARLEK